MALTFQLNFTDIFQLTKMFKSDNLYMDNKDSHKYFAFIFDSVNHKGTVLATSKHLSKICK